MSYEILLDRLFKINDFQGKKRGLQNMEQLQRLFNYPDLSFASVHIAGTNGKGSVAKKIAAGFEEAGYRTALFTSPHISCFRERISINGRMIDEHQVEILLRSIFETMAKYNIPATFFEVATCLSLLYFSQQKVDVAVIETGLGGRLDATNVITPLLSIITSISIDHIEQLGTNLESITKEKGGIIKPHIPILIGPTVPLKSIQEIAVQQHSPLFQIEQIFPTFEEENRFIAKRALELLSARYNLKEGAIQKGLKAKQPCRFEVIEGNPLIILDVAHNPGGLIALFESVEQNFTGSPIRVLFGLSKTKEISSCLKIILSKGSRFHLVEAPNGRGVPTNKLRMQSIECGCDPSYLFEHAHIFEGINESRKLASEEGEILVICGSFFIMDEVRQAIVNH